MILMSNDIKDNICFGFKVSDKANKNAFEKVKQTFITSSYPFSDLKKVETEYMAWLSSQEGPTPNKYTNKSGARYLYSKYLPNSYLSAKSICKNAKSIMDKDTFEKAGKTEMQKYIKTHKTQSNINYLTIINNAVVKGATKHKKKDMNIVLVYCMNYVEENYND